MSQLADKLTDEEIDDLRQAIDNPNIFASHISSALRARGHNLSEYVICRHRKNRCATCQR